MVGEHDVPPGMAGRGDGLERPGAQLEYLSRGDPLIGLGVPEVTWRWAHARLDHLVDQRLGPGPDQSPRLRRGLSEVIAQEHVERGPFVDAQRHLRPETLAECDRLRVVVPVDVGDQEPADVAETGADARQRAGELV